MVKYGENFFTSLGFAPLPETFWTPSMFTKPRDREVVCHASAWDIDSQDDLRIKMCIEPTAEDFYTIHHELGHNFYQRAYKGKDFLFRDSANDGFHEAVGDTIALSVTPAYLQKVGLLKTGAKNPKATLRYTWVPYDRISGNRKRAMVAAEDAKFVEHEGFDWEGIQLAIEKNQKNGRVAVETSGFCKKRRSDGGVR